MLTTGLDDFVGVAVAPRNISPAFPRDALSVQELVQAPISDGGKCSQDGPRFVFLGRERQKNAVAADDTNI